MASNPQAAPAAHTPEPQLGPLGWQIVRENGDTEVFGAGTRGYRAAKLRAQALRAEPHRQRAAEVVAGCNHAPVAHHPLDEPGACAPCIANALAGIAEPDAFRREVAALVEAAVRLVVSAEDCAEWCADSRDSAANGDSEACRVEIKRVRAALAPFGGGK